MNKYSNCKLRMLFKIVICVCTLIAVTRSAMMYNCKGEGAEKYEGYVFPTPTYTQSVVNFKPFNATMRMLDDSTTCDENAYVKLMKEFTPEFVDQKMTVWVSDSGGCPHSVKLDYAQRAGISATIVSSAGDGILMGQTGREVNQPFETETEATTPLFQCYAGDLPVVLEGVMKNNCSLYVYPDVNPWLEYYSKPYMKIYQGFFLTAFGVLIIAGILYIIVNIVYIRKMMDTRTTSHTSQGTVKSDDDNEDMQTRRQKEEVEEKTTKCGLKGKKKRKQRVLVFNAAITVFLIETVSNIFNFVYNLDPYSYLGLFTRRSLLAMYYSSYNIPVVSTLLLAIEWMHVSHQRATVKDKTSTWLIAHKKWFILGTCVLVGMTIIETFLVITYNSSGNYAIIARVVSYLTGVGTTIYFLVSISSCIKQIRLRMMTITKENAKRHRSTQLLIRRMIAAAVIISVANIGNILLDIITLLSQFQNYTDTAIVYFVIRSTLIVAQSSVKIFAHDMKNKLKVVFLHKNIKPSQSDSNL